MRLRLSCTSLCGEIPLAVVHVIVTTKLRYVVLLGTEKNFWYVGHICVFVMEFLAQAGFSLDYMLALNATTLATATPRLSCEQYVSMVTFIEGEIRR